MATRKVIKVVVGAIAFLIASAVWVWFLRTQGLERADQISSVVGIGLNTLLGVAGIVLGIYGLLDKKNQSSNAPDRDGSPGRHNSGTFNITAGRDSYSANEMTINQRKNESE